MLDVFHASQLRYSYKIDRLFKDYQTIKGNTIEIGGLPYGRYTLKIRGRGADNRFSTETLPLSLVVVRPFYLHWWFILLILALITVSAFQAYQWRVRQLQERKRELELLIEERTSQIRKDKAIIEQDKETIEAQATQLRELDELKSKFFANISHELRTPLTLLLAPIEIIIKSEPLSQNGFTYLHMMRQNGQKLLKRINELLDLSQLDANRLEVNEQSTFLYPFFKKLLSSFESAANLKGIELLFKYQLNKNIQAKLDDDKVEKILSNFLSNALKFTPKDGIIELQVSSKAERILISVKDTGIGILPNDLIKIFDRFYQSKTEKRQQGSGIGLSLCRELAKVLNGRVWATSEINTGSTFYLELPFVETFAVKEESIENSIIPAPLISETPSNRTAANAYRPNILIAEDNPDLCQLLTMILAEHYHVIAVENGQEALEYLTVVDEQSTTKHSNHLPSIVITDIMMPIMDGIELLTKIKNTPKLQHIPIIMLTARQSIEVKIEALRIGVDDYLTKPFRKEELLARVANLIKNSQNRRMETEDEPLQNKNLDLKTTLNIDLVWLKELEQILINNIGNSNFKISDAASQMALSPRRLQQKIKQITGLTPKKYQRTIILNKARAILKSGKVQTVSEVMHQIGYDNRHHFTKIYWEEFGIKPIEELKS